MVNNNGAGRLKCFLTSFCIVPFSVSGSVMYSFAYFFCLFMVLKKSYVESGRAMSTSDGIYHIRGLAHHGIPIIIRVCIAWWICGQSWVLGLLHRWACDSIWWSTVVKKKLFGVCQGGIGVCKQVKAYHPSPVREEHCVVQYSVLMIHWMGLSLEL